MILIPHHIRLARKAYDHTKRERSPSLLCSRSAVVSLAVRIYHFIILFVDRYGSCFRIPIHIRFQSKLCKCFLDISQWKKDPSVHIQDVCCQWHRLTVYHHKFLSECKLYFCFSIHEVCCFCHRLVFYFDSEDLRDHPCRKDGPAHVDHRCNIHRSFDTLSIYYYRVFHITDRKFCGNFAVCFDLR